MPSDDIQSLIDSVGPGGTLRLEPPKREFEGPVVVRNPLTIEGQNATIWAAKGPVLSVEENGVVLEALNVEITGNEAQLSGREACALVIRRGLGVTLNDVTVRGNVDGLEEEEGEWRYPRSIRLRTIKAGHRHEFRVRLVAPVQCRLVSGIAGLAVEPRGLRGGPCEITFKLDPLASGTRIRGDIRIQTAFLTRQIKLTGNASDDSKAVIGTGEVIWEPGDWGKTRPSRPAEKKTETATVEAPPRAEEPKRARPPLPRPPAPPPRKGEAAPTEPGTPKVPPVHPPRRDLPTRERGPLPDIFKEKKEATQPASGAAPPPASRSSHKVVGKPSSALWFSDADGSQQDARPTQPEPEPEPAPGPTHAARDAAGPKQGETPAAEASRPRAAGKEAPQTAQEKRARGKGTSSPEHVPPAPKKTGEPRKRKLRKTGGSVGFFGDDADEN